MQIQRIELYDLVWSTPVTEIANQFKTTGSEIRKICTTNNIPLPENGYWMKLKFGKKVNIIPLPESDGFTNEIEIAKKEPKSRRDLQKEGPNIEQIKEEYPVPKRLTNPDILIQDALIEFEKRNWHSSNDHLITLFDSVRIKATKPLFNRALIFMDTLIKIFRKKGYDVEIKNRETYVIIGSEKIQISCREKIKRTFVQEERWRSAKDSATGLLTFNIEGFHPKQWIDGKKKLEEQIAQILNKLEEEAERLRIRHLEIKEYWKVKDEKERIEKEKEDLRQKEISDFIKLMNDAERFQKAKIAREFIEAVEKNAAKKKVLTEETQRWIEWAKKKIDWLDPIVNFPDSSFENIEKEQIFSK